MEMNKYQIIADKDELQRFINWLSDLEADETYYIGLFARKKYAPEDSMTHINRDKDQLKRFTTDKKQLISKIRQCEVEVGAYKTRDGHPIQQETLAIYITPNPRSQTRAGRHLLIELANRVTRPYDGYNVRQLAMTSIHKSKSRTVWIDFDFDTKDPESIKQIASTIVNKDAVTVLTTRGGLHLLVEQNKIAPEFKKSFYQKFKSLPGCDISGDNMIPIPGCFQGGFIPSLSSL